MYTDNIGFECNFKVEIKYVLVCFDKNQYDAKNQHIKLRPSLDEE